MHRKHPTRRFIMCSTFSALLVIVLAGTGLDLRAMIIAAAESDPVAIWPAGPLDVVASFRKPVDPHSAAGLVGKTIPYYELSPDRVASLPPPRQRGSLRIVASRLIDDGRTLELATDPHPLLARYVLPPVDAVEIGHQPNGLGSKFGYTLNGVAVTWAPLAEGLDADGWSGWWPVFDSDTVRRLTIGSRPHEKGMARLQHAGTLTMSSLIQLPQGKITITFSSNTAIDDLTLGDAQAELMPAEKPGDHFRARVSQTCDGAALFMSATVSTKAGAPDFSCRAAYTIGELTIEHAFEPAQLILPWAPVPSTSAAAPAVVPDISGGDPGRGQQVFYGEKARCSQCHAIRGQGGKIGPDLSDVSRKGRAEIYRAIAAPSAAIDPEYLSYTVASKNGQVVVGVVRADGPGSVSVTDTNAHTTVIARSDIDQIRPSANSIMPVGLVGALGDAAVRDLLAYLSALPGDKHAK